MSDKKITPMILSTNGAIQVPQEDEAAAALAAVSCYLEAEQLAFASGMEQEHRSCNWQTSKVLTNQGVSLVRTPCRPTWKNIERLRRAGSDGSGVVGI